MDEMLLPELAMTSPNDASYGSCAFASGKGEKCKPTIRFVINVTRLAGLDNAALNL
jgi:hypothetical protein